MLSRSLKKEQSRRQVIIGFLGFFSSVALPAVQAGREVRIDVQEPRPLAKAVQILSYKTGWRITYEDLPVMNSADVVDRTSPTAGQTSSTRILLPVSGRINTSLFIPDDPGKANPAALIAQLLDNYRAMGNSGTFVLIESGSTFHIVPAKTRDLWGRLIDVRPILDTSISFPEQDRTLYATLKEICASLEQETGTRVAIMGGPGQANRMVGGTERIGAANQKARKVLQQSLDATGVNLTWQLYWDPGLRVYGLNIAEVMIEEPTPTGRYRLRPMPPE